MSDTNKQNCDCGIVLFHATRKENIPKIMKEGLKPGAGKGWCHAVFEEKLSKQKLRIDETKQECDEYIFASGALDKMEDLVLKEGLGSDTILMMCVPQKDIMVGNKSFDEWDEDRDIGKDVISNYGEIKVKNGVSPECIIGCLDVVSDTPISNLGTYKVNKELCRK